MLVGGLRALLVQGLEPRAMAAVDQHSQFREDPWGRLARTTSFVVDTTYGDTATAEAAAARVRAVHTRIHGVDPVTGRSLPRRRPRPAAVDPRGRGRLVPARVPHVRRTVVA